jgi:cytochrome c
VIRSVYIAFGCAIVMSAPAMAQDVAAGEKDFLVCRACHQIGPTAKDAVGPVLNGVVGRKAGSDPNFNYSSANKESGITWTAEELNKYLESPQTVVPHTKMMFPGVRDEAKRKDIIAYLSQFGPDGAKK